MPTRAPSIFDELPRMRMPAASYSPAYDYRKIIKELRLACKANGFIGISPQNIVRGMPLLPVVASEDEKGELRFFVDPKIEKMSGIRPRYEACGNIHVLCGDKQFGLAVLTARPTRITISARDEEGRKKLQHFTDREQFDSVRNGFIGIICHEIEHLGGRLIADIARETLIKVLARLDERLTREERSTLLHHTPFALVREGDVYRLKFGMEFRYGPVPEVSSDVVFFSPRFVDAWFMVNNSAKFHVSRGGERLPIVPSDSLQLLLKD